MNFDQKLLENIYRTHVISVNESSINLDEEYFALLKNKDQNGLKRLIDIQRMKNGYSSDIKYHGSDKKFNIFKNIGGKVHILFSAVDVKRTGYFFSDSEEIAESFGKYVNKFYLKQNKIGDLSKRHTQTEEDLINSGVNENWLNSKETWELFDDEDGEFLVAKLKSLGYDSVTIDEPSVENERAFSISTVVFDPNQIKLADFISKDDNGNIIPLSKRFDQSINDIRY
jgi:hypothetical protein